MAEIKVKIPEKLMREIDESEMDISSLLERFVKQLEEEREMVDWSVELQRASRRGRFDELREKGLI